MQKRITGLSLFLAVFLSLFLVSCSSGKVAEIPEPVGYVNDFAGMISSEDENELESILIQYENQTNNEIVVVTVESLGDKSIEEYSIALAEKWKVGKEDEDNGVIILVAEEEKKIRIEVGYGLEGLLTDAEAKLIIDREMTPSFKEEEFAVGIALGAWAIMDTIDGIYIPSEPLPPEESGGWPLWLIILFIVFIVFGGAGGIGLIAALVLGGRGGYWSSGGIGGGSRFGGFGGGSFGGGGASGRW